MKTNSLLAYSMSILCVTCIAGCTDPQRAPLSGRWVLEEPGRVMERIDGDADDRDQEIDSINDSTSPPRMMLTFASSGQLGTQTAMGNVNRQKKGAWQVISFDEAAHKMTIRCIIGSEETDHDVELIDRSTIRLVPPNMAGLSMKMRFVRDE